MVEILLEQGFKEDLVEWELIDEDQTDPFDDAMEILK
jgi:hypothetical protein